MSLRFIAQAQNTVDAISFVDKAAAASDRWLFIAAIVLILFFAFAVIKYLVNELATARKEASEVIRKLYEDMARMNTTMTVTVQENNTLLRQNVEMMKELGQRLRQ